MSPAHIPCQDPDSRPAGRHNGSVPPTPYESGIDPLAAAEVIDLVRDLLRIDSSNFGDGTGPGEAEAAEFVQGVLVEAGIDAERFSTSAHNRQGVVTRIAGTDPSRPALMVHAHLDTVPAIAADWSVPPFSGEVHDGMIWGRGAIDMKDSVGMLLATMRGWQRTGARPERDIVVLFTPDEEAGGNHGAHWLVDHRRDLFDGVTEAVGEVGGFSITVNDDLRLYTIQTAEKGIEWMRLTATGRAGHGSMIATDNAVTALCDAVARIGRHRFPLSITPTVRAFIDSISEALGVELDVNDPEALLATLGPLARLIGATLQDTSNPSMLTSGYKVNVIPEHAVAHVDGRYLPGHRDEFLATIDQLIGGQEGGVSIVRESVMSDIAVETGFDGPTIDAMASALQEIDPGARTVPYMLSGGTDAKAISTLGIRCFGFVPLRLPPTLDFAALFHGIDERVPIDALEFGVSVLDRFLRRA